MIHGKSTSFLKSGRLDIGKNICLWNLQKFKGEWNFIISFYFKLLKILFNRQMNGNWYFYSMEWGYCNPIVNMFVSSIFSGYDKFLHHPMKPLWPRCLDHALTDHAASRRLESNPILATPCETKFVSSLGECSLISSGTQVYSTPPSQNWPPWYESILK